MKSLSTFLLNADEDTFHEHTYTFLCQGPAARDIALSWLRSPEPLHRERACHVLAEVQRQPISGKEGGSPYWEIDHTPVPLLIQVLENDPDTNVRLAAARALDFQKQPESMPALLRSASSGEPDFCYWVARALSLFGEYEKQLQPYLGTAQQVVLRLLDSSDKDVRDWAARSSQYAAFNTPAINDALLRLTGDSCGSVRGEALSSLACHGDRRSIPAIRLALRDASTVLWPWLFQGLVTMQAVELIPDLLANGSKDARAAAWKLQK